MGLKTNAAEERKKTILYSNSMFCFHHQSKQQSYFSVSVKKGSAYFICCCMIFFFFVPFQSNWYQVRVKLLQEHGKMISFLNNLLLCLLCMHLAPSPNILTCLVPLCLHKSSNLGSTYFRSQTEFQSTNGCGSSGLQSGLRVFTLELNPGLNLG